MVRVMIAPVVVFGSAIVYCFDDQILWSVSIKIC